jgi:DNA-binding transcriptional ArsR family regulator
MSNYSLVLRSITQSGEPIPVDLIGFKKAALVLRALNHKLRQQIIRIIDEKEKITVTELYMTLRLEQSVASQHLAILRKAGFVNTTRQGKYVYYTINGSRIKELNKFIDQLVN